MDITVKELRDRMDASADDYILIDVREPHERAEFNIGGDHIPLGDIPTRLQELADAKDKEVVVYCRSGNRSGMACDFLRQQGFTNVRNLQGGMLAWQE